MLGAATNPKLDASDLALKELAKDIGKEAHFEAAKVAIYLANRGVQ
ncbi:hypothetical protein [Polaribacter filamentus]|nr:hypothetical protein [Polaribacter filamentus]